MLRVLIVEDHALLRESLLRALEELAPDVAPYQAQGAEEALRALETEGEFDLVLLDLMLPGLNGVSLLSIMRKRFPSMPVVIVSAFDDIQTVSRVLRQGASGFVPKADFNVAMLTGALRKVLEGEIFLPESLREEIETSRRNGHPLAGRFRLTNAQMRVLDLLIQGKPNREIAEALGITEGTVKVHVVRIFRALNVSNRAQAMLAVSNRQVRLPRFS